MPFLLANSLAKQRENRGIKRQNAFAQSCAKNAKNVGKSKKKALFKGFCVVEVTGFEPATFWSRTKRATKLRYTSIKNGADKGTRTLDLMITNQPLYQLSYIGIQANEACCFISIN